MLNIILLMTLYCIILSKNRKIYNCDNIITFEDPKTYQGPILEGWPPNKSRNMKTYIKPGQNSILNDYR